MLINPNFKENYGAQLLQYRGIEKVEEYINPPKSYHINPEKLDNIKRGIDLLRETLKEDKRILLVVDSDVDGFTSAAIMYNYIKILKPDIEIDYLLHEGKQHGLEDHINSILEYEKPIGLIICPDSSSNDYVYHEMLKDIAPVLVLDHHLTDQPLSDNAIIINNQLSKDYENKELTGAGVAYQFCRYYDCLYKLSYAKDLIDLAALGIIGDMGSVLSLENRYIIKTGLSNIKNSFILALMEKQAYSITGKSFTSIEDVMEKMNPITVAFFIVPLINAMIRVGTMEEKERLFEAFINGECMVKSKKRGANGTLEKISVESARECTNARTKQNRIKEKAADSLEAKIYKEGLLDNKILFIELDKDLEDFPSTLNGLLAMELVAKFKKPTIVVRRNDKGYLKGSIRGLNDSAFNHFKSYLTQTGLFEYVQGHENAAGCDIHYKKVKDFINQSNKDLEKYDFNEDYFDVNFSKNAIDKDLSDLIYDLNEYKDLWGQSNTEPMILVKDINLKREDIQICGARNDTIRFEKFGITFIQFFAKEMIENLEKMEGEIKMEVIGTANVNEWMGRTNPQINIKKYEIKDGRLEF